MKTIAYEPAAAKHLRKLPADAREALIAKLHRYAETGAGDVETFKGLKGGRRLRSGDWRIVFVETAEQLIVVRAGNRRDVYD